LDAWFACLPVTGMPGASEALRFATSAPGIPLTGEQWHYFH